ncbi:hypothetical protein LPW11_20390 [Geomonas sp. RF6]|uniref:hypothetical protein n=1 Tax=Geomonas sp. RF6 TaxID=2897342 RepID=UPI001E3C84C4|nr:hypothetical protein [Geomonas sp. RF6]UFS70220.1 hypothetical protein LPW11_20390 [Geomonas sp. RF6]
MMKLLLAVGLISSALMASTVQAEPAPSVQEGKAAAPPAHTKGGSALSAREQRSEVKKRAAERRKTLMEGAAGIMEKKRTPSERKETL